MGARVAFERRMLGSGRKFEPQGINNSFVQQIVTDHLLCVGHFQVLGYSPKQNRQRPPLVELTFLGAGGRG